MSGFIVPAEWPVPAGVHAAVTTRHSPGISQPPYDRCNLGAHCGDDPAHVAANRAGLIDVLGLPSAPVWLRQVHGVAVADGDAARAGDEPQADAAVARTRAVVLAVLTADCLPLLFCAADGSAIGVAHAGWRGLAAGVIEATLEHMRIPVSAISVWLGPAIAAASYEVGEEVRAAFTAGDAASSAAFVVTRPGHWRCDLTALARRRLLRAGVHSIHGGGFDTFHDPRFPSYRRAPRCGRFATLIWRS